MSGRFAGRPDSALSRVSTDERVDVSRDPVPGRSIELTGCTRNPPVRETTLPVDDTAASVETELADTIEVFVSWNRGSSKEYVERFLQIVNRSHEEVIDVWVEVNLRSRCFEHGCGRRFSAQPASFDDFVATFKRYLIACIQRVGVSREDTEDIAQATLVVVWQQMSKGRVIDKPVGYLKTVAVRLALAHVRAGRRIQPSAAVSDVADATAGSALRRVELRADLERAVRTLPRRMREILTLHLADLSDDEIARRMGISKGTVGTQLTRARKKLRPLLGGWEAE